MRILIIWLAIYFGCTIFNSQIYGQGTFKSGPIPEWVEKIDFEKRDNEDQSPYDFLLTDKQENTVLQQDYFHIAFQIYNSEGVQEMSSISLDYDPSYESIIFHEILIHRNGSVESRSVKDFNILSREKDIERALYDGHLTAIKELEDIRKGDIVEYAYTTSGYNPIYGKDKFTSFYQDFGVYVDRLYHSYIIDKQVNIKYSDGATKATMVRDGQNFIYKWDLKNIEPVYEDSTVPAWYDQYKIVRISSMNDLSNVVDWADKLYLLSKVEKSKLRSEISSRLSLGGSATDILEAIRFVQDEIRYLGFEEGISAFKPHSPLDVLKRRFGDCKDKSFLLSSVLQEMGIDAAPMLVHSTNGHVLDNSLSSPDQFDHCIVTFVKNQKQYFIDPTISNQGGNLNSIAVPNYIKGLPIKKGVSEFLPFKKHPIPQIISEELIEIDSVTNGSAKYFITTTYSGNQADYQRSYFESNSRSDIKQYYKEYYQNSYPDIKITLLELIDTSRSNENMVVVNEEYEISNIWEEDEKYLNLNLYSLVLNDYLFLKPHEKTSMPYYLGEPLEYVQNLKVKLPETWAITNEKKEVNNENFKYGYSVSYANKLLQIKHKYELKNGIVSPEDVDQVLKDADEVLNDINYQLTYNKALLKRGEEDQVAWQAWLTWFIGILLGGLFARWMYIKYEPKPNHLNLGIPIGGWLIIPALGLVFTPFRIIMQIINFSNDGVYLASSWALIMSEYSFGFILYCFIEGIINPILFVWSIVLIVLFFKKRSNVPNLMIAFYIFTFLIVVGDSILLNLINYGDSIFQNDLIRSLISTCIWVPYFMYSDRVKRTFTRLYNNPPTIISNEEE